MVLSCGDLDAFGEPIPRTTKSTEQCPGSLASTGHLSFFGDVGCNRTKIWGIDVIERVGRSEFT
jgi:hypothetical protein